MTNPDTPYDPNLAAGLDGDDADWDDAPILPRARMPRPTKLLLVVVIAAAAFAGGVFAQRHWGKTTGSGGSASAAAARFGGAGSLAGRLGTTAGGRTGTGRGVGGATIGQVAYLKGTILYVTGADGNTIKVSVPKGTPVTKSVTTTVRALRPGDMVVVRGTTRTDGTVAAESVSIGGTGGSFVGGGFGGGTGLDRSAGSGATGFGGGSRSGAPTGFGN